MIDCQIHREPLLSRSVGAFPETSPPAKGGFRLGLSPHTLYSMSAESDAILLARDGPVATLTLNRPAALNSLDTAMLDALVAHTAMVAADATLRCVVIEGAGKHFMAGGDLKTFAGLLDLPQGERRTAFTKLVGRLHAAIENLRVTNQQIVIVA